MSYLLSIVWAQQEDKNEQDTDLQTPYYLVVDIKQLLK